MGATEQPAGPGPPHGAGNGTRQFFETLYQLSLNGDVLDSNVEAEIRPVWPNKKEKRNWRYTPVTNLTAAVAACNLAGEGDYNVYAGVHLRQRGVIESKEENIAVLTSAFADVDCQKHGIDRQRVFDLALAAPWGPPTMAVWSGAGWHFYWVYREQLDAQDEAEGGDLADHSRIQRWLRAWFNDSLDTDGAADEMYTRDRLLRVPGFLNVKLDRRRDDGSYPRCELILCEPKRIFDRTDFLEWVPVGWAPPAKSKSGPALDPDELPTQIPNWLRRVISAAGLRVVLVRDKGGGIKVLRLVRCPACGQEDKACRLSVVSGRLFSYHANSCPAGATATGKREGNEAGRGIPLHEWVARFAPQALDALNDPSPEPQYNVGDGKIPRLVQDLAEAQGCGQDGALSDWLSARGIHAEVVAQLVEHGELLWVDEQVAAYDGLGRTARAVAMARPGPAPLLPLRDLHGVFRTAGWPAADGTMPLISRKIGGVAADLPACAAIMGDVPAAIRAGAAGVPVVVADGPLEWLAARGMQLAGELRAEVISCWPAKALPELVAEMRDAWARADSLPPRVFFVARAGHPRQHLDAAADLLEGRAGVAVYEPTTPSASGGLLESAAHFGLAPTARALLLATARHHTPIDIQRAEAVIEEDLERAVRRAGRRSIHKGQTLTIYDVAPGAGKSTIGMRVAARVASGELPLPGRSRRARTRGSAATKAQLRRVAFAMPNHKLAEEKHGDFNKKHVAGPDAAKRLLKGALAYCAYKERVDDVFAAVGRRGICGPKDDPDQRCPEADGGCLGAVDPSVEPGEVAFMAHALAPHVDVDLAIIDESPGVVEARTFSEDEIGSLFASRVHPRVKSWRQAGNPDAGEAARLLCDVIGPLASQHAADVTAGRQAPFAKRITGEALCLLLESSKHLLPLLESGFAAGARKPPVPTPVEARDGVHAGRYMPSRLAFQGLQDLLAFYRRVRKLEHVDELPIFGQDESEKAPKPIAVLTLEPNQKWALEIRQVRKLPKCPTIILDATGSVTRAEWEAAYPDRKIEFVKRQVAGRAPLRAVHVKTKAFSRRALFHEGGGLRQHVASRVRRILRMAANEVAETRRKTPGDAKPSLGLLSYLPIWRGLAEPDTSQHPSEKELGWVSAELQAEGFDTIYGYFGKHDRGTNAFEAVDALVVLGDARENLGSIEIDCELLGLEVEKVSSDRSQATLIQSMFRARHTRRRDGKRALLVYAGAQRPNIPGVVWDTGALLWGPPPTEAAARAAIAVRLLAEETGGVVGMKLIRSWEFAGEEIGRFPINDVSDDVIRRAIAAYVKQKKLNCWDFVHGSGRVRFSLWAATEAQAIDLARRHFGARRASRRNRHENTSEFRDNAARNGSNIDPQPVEDAEGVPKSTSDSAALEETPFLDPEACRAGPRCARGRPPGDAGAEASDDLDEEQPHGLGPESDEEPLFGPPPPRPPCCRRPRTRPARAGSIHTMNERQECMDRPPSSCADVWR